MNSKFPRLLAASLLLCAFGAETALAQQTSAQLKNVSTGRCVKTPTVPYARETPVTISSCVSSVGESQTVKFVTVSPGVSSIRTADGGACLNLRTSKENREGGRVKWVGCSSHPDQLWKLTGVQTVNGMQNKIQNVRSGKCLNVHRGAHNRDGGPVTVYSCANTPDQRWTWKNTAGKAGLNDIKIASHNVWFITLGPGWGLVGQKAGPMRQRARDIAADGYLKGQDVLVLNELYHDDISNELMRSLRRDYPHQTDVAGRTSGGSETNWDRTWGNNRTLTRLEAGVAVLSKWPIVRQEQYLFPKSDLCGWDEESNKGFVYTKINYQNSRMIHVIATHLQSEVSLACRDANTPGFTGGYHARNRELRAMRSFIDSKRIPASEPVFVVGDLNINFGTREADQMLNVLKANRPIFTGNRGSYDGSPDEHGNYNPLVGNNLYPEILDYVLTLKGHAAPTKWYTEIRRKNGMSDHYPVFGSTKRTGNAVNPDLSEYRIKIHTPHSRGGGTNSNVVAIINGQSGKSRRVLLNDRIYHNAFEQGSTEVVKVEAENLVNPKSITLEFNAGGYKPDWRINRISVQKIGSNTSLMWAGDYEFTSAQNKTFPLR